MNEEEKEKLDREYAAERFGIYAPFIVIIALLFVITAWYIFNQPTSSQIVVGVAMNHRALLHDEGHDIFLYVALDDRKQLVKVRLPGKTPIRVGEKVEMNRLFSDGSDYEKYVFHRYVND